MTATLQLTYDYYMTATLVSHYNRQVVGNTKVLYQSQFCHQNHMLGSVHDSDRDGVVRIPECLSNSQMLFTQHNHSPARSVIICLSLITRYKWHCSPIIFGYL